MPDSPTPVPTWTKATVVLNRASGAVSALGPETLAEDLKTEFLKNGITAKVHAVKGAELKDAFQQAMADDSDAVMVAGGDGTVAAAASLLAGGNKPLGILPFGTFNIVARDLNIPLDWQKAVAALSAAPATRMDLMEVNGGLYCCVCVLGFFPALKMAQPEHHGNWVVRMLKTSLRAFRSMATFPPLDLKLVLDGREIHRRSRFALLANNDYEEMFGLIPRRKSINGGYFTVYVSNHRTNIGMTRALISWILGRFKQDKELTIFHTSELDIVVHRKGVIPVMVDGEVKKLTSPLKIRTRPLELCVLAPEVVKETVEVEEEPT